MAKELCFICCREMVEVEGKLYKICSNEKCVRHEALQDQVETTNTEVTADGGRTN